MLYIDKQNSPNKVTSPKAATSSSASNVVNRHIYFSKIFGVINDDRINSTYSISLSGMQFY